MTVKLKDSDAAFSATVVIIGRPPIKPPLITAVLDVADATVV